MSVGLIAQRAGSACDCGGVLRASIQCRYAEAVAPVVNRGGDDGVAARANVRLLEVIWEMCRLAVLLSVNEQD